MLPINPMTMILLGVIAVLLFGERLPEVGKSFGKQLMELKKQFRTIQDEIGSAFSGAKSTINQATSSLSYPSYSSQNYDEMLDDQEEAIAPKFEPPPSGDPPPAQTAAAQTSEPPSGPAAV